MITILLKSLTSIGLKLIATIGSKELVEWLVFKAAEVAVKSTKTKADDEFLKKVKETYEQSN